MDLRQLRQFVVVAEELNFRRAAERLRMSQPPLSVAIRRLEASIGAPLLTRSRSSVALTAAGVTLLREARYLLRQAELSLAATRAAVTGSQEVLRIKSIDSAMLDRLPALLETFRAAEPEILLSLSTGSTREILAAVDAGTVDIGVCVPGGDGHPRLAFRPWYRERFCLAVQEGHRLARRRTVRLPALADAQLVAHYPHEAGPGYHAALSVAIQDAGARGRALQSEPDLLATLGLVRLALGVALVPASARRIGIDRIVYVDVVSARGDAIAYPVALVARSEPAATAGALLRLLPKASSQAAARLHTSSDARNPRAA